MLCPCGTALSLTPPHQGSDNVLEEEVGRAGRWARVQGNAVWTSQSYYNPCLLAAVVTHARTAQNPASRDLGIARGGALQARSLLRAVGS